MTEAQKQPSVIRFEQEVAAKSYESACIELLDILSKIDSNFGGVEGIEIDYPSQLNDELVQDKIKHLCTRVAVAMSELFSDPKLDISEGGAQRFFTLQRWINMIFASSPFVNADHVLQAYNRNPDKTNLSDFHLDNTKSSLIKFCILYLPESNINVNLDALWNLDPELCASLCFALQSPRFIGTEQSFSKRGTLLQWFPEKLATIENLNNIPSAISHDVYMHCSYDIAENKHWVKKALNQVIRRHLLQGGWVDRDVTKLGERDGKPVMVVLLEHFHSSHSIYRTHSTSMIAARERFHLIGVGNDAVDEAGQAVFDEFHLLKGDNIFGKLNELKEICEKNGAAVLYMPSIGMDLTTIFASNTRLAPQHVEYRLRENPEVVNIGIASTTMKLNPYFLAALKAIRDRANVKVHFHFALGQSSGVTHPYVERFIKSYLGNDATAHPHAPYDQYLRILHNCDMMVNPFPFGNTNGIIDMVTLGLVGVCKTGAEVHEHIDEGLFKRLGLPEWLIANTVDEYVERTIRLAENHQERLELRRHIIENNGLQTLFTGDPSPMGKVLLEKFEEWKAANLAEKPKKKATKSATTKEKATKSTTEKKSVVKSEGKSEPKKMVKKSR